MLACPLNPAELLIIEGKYASKPPLPARLGIEGAGRVLALGEAVPDLAPPQRLGRPARRGAWIRVT